MSWLEPLPTPIVVWNGQLETELVKQQQRPAPSLQAFVRVAGAGRRPLTEKRRSLRLRVLDRMADGAWWSASQLALEIGEDRRRIGVMVCELTQAGVCEKDRAFGQRVRTQRYRLRQTGSA